MTAVLVTDVRLAAATAADRATGLLGFVTLTLAGTVTIDGIALRRTLEGDLTLAFPTRTDRWGNVHAIVRPVDDSVRRSLTQAVLQVLGLAPSAAEIAAHRQAESRP
jgi:DNA-binding cell septation regulator SpoVG